VTEDVVLTTPNIQRYLVPRRPYLRVSQVEIAHFWDPLDEIGGDFLYYERIGTRYVCLEVGDVMGHGAQAGLVMTALHGLFFGLRQRIAPLHQMLSDANSFLCRLRHDPHRDSDAFVKHMMCTMLLLRLDLQTGVLAYCNAGHPAALYLAHSAEGSIIPLQGGGPILGVIDSAKYEELAMRPIAGDTLLVFTDGVSESCNDKDDEYGNDRLRHLLQRIYTLSPREIVAEIKQTIAQFRGSAARTDDCAVAVMQFGPKWLSTRD
jgi:sigma-B regulation protein RsbU (phosphoserine phosphatase)